MIDVKVPPPLSYDLSRNILVKEKFLDTSICQELIDEHEEKVLKGSSVYNKGTYSKYDFPINHSIHQKLAQVWVEANDYFGTNIDFVEPYNIKKYSFGNFYDYHTDHFTSKLDRRLSMVVQLSNSNDYGGGDLQVIDKSVTREIGSVIIFPSYYRHKVSQVGFGERWVLIGWAWGYYN